jgi:UTP--glucose-1-phosphate uridylyltransferase
MVKNILPKGIECIFVRQPEQLGLGHAVLCAERVVGSEPFALILADDFLVSESDGITSDLIRSFKKSGKNQLSIMKVIGPEISKYGVVSINNKTGLASGLIEKPSFENAPSNLASIGRYILTPDIFKILRSQSRGVLNEIQLADAINTQALNGKVETVLLNGKRFDCGNIEGYIEAIKYAATSYKFD